MTIRIPFEPALRARHRARSLRMGLGLVALLLPGFALARNLEPELDALDVKVGEVEQRSTSIERRVRPGGSFISDAEAMRRFEDYLYLYMVKSYQPAAEGFYALVTTASLSDAGLHRDAEWYLAECLREMGNLSTAEAQYKVISEDSSHPFRDDAIRRLLEVYAAGQRSEDFYHYYEKWIVRGLVKPSDLITYSVAKSLYTQGDTVKAKSMMLEVSPSSAWYGRARYFLGAVLVAEGDLEAAAQYFREVVELSVEDDASKQVQDLAFLALGRLYLEQERFDEAADWYGRISGDSEYLPDKLYELVWTFIRQRERVLSQLEDTSADLADDDRTRLDARQRELIKEALRGVEIFLLAYPEHEYTGQLKLIQGHLHMQAVQYDAALATYEQVILDYTPIRERFAELATSTQEPRKYFQEILSLEDRNTYESTTDGLPAYALAMMASDTDLSRALTIYRELEQQQRDVAASESLIAELQHLLGATSGIGGFESLRYDAVLQQDIALQSQIALLRLEEEWLLDTLPSTSRRQAEALSSRLDAIERDADEASAAMAGEQERLRVYAERVQKAQRQRAQLAEQVDRLEEEASGYQKKIAAPDLDPATREAASGTLATLEDDLSEAKDRLRTAETTLADLMSTPVQWARSERLASVVTGVAALHTDFQGLASQIPMDKRPMASRFATQQAKLMRSHDLLASALSRLDGTEAQELDRIKTRFDQEVAEVARQRQELDATLAEAETVSLALTRAGFGRLEDFFSESVLRADMGIVDVYWSQKVEVMSEKSHVQGEKNRLLSDLEERFEFIRQKMNQ